MTLDLGKASLNVVASKYCVHESGIVTITGWSDCLTNVEQTIVFTVTDQDDQLEWTFLIDSDPSTMSTSAVSLRIPGSSISHRISVSTKVVREVPGKRSKVRVYRLTAGSRCRAIETNVSGEGDTDLASSFKNLKVRSNEILLDLRPRLREDLRIESHRETDMTFIAKDSLLPAEHREKFRTDENSVSFQIYQGNRYLRDLKLALISNKQTKTVKLHLEVRDDGVLSGKVVERNHAVNKAQFTLYRRIKIDSPRIAVNEFDPIVKMVSSDGKVSVSVETTESCLHLWRITATSKSKPHESHFIVTPVEGMLQTIRIPCQALRSGTRYDLIVEGLQLLSRKESPVQHFRICCRSSTQLRLSEPVRLVRNSFDRAAVMIPTAEPSVSFWQFSVRRLLTATKAAVEPRPDQEKNYVVQAGSVGEVFEFPLLFKAGWTYEVTVEGKSHEKRTLCRKRKIFRAEMTHEELKLLHKRASEDQSHACCKWLYRNKPPKYFEDIQRIKGNLMEPYDKDNSGDPASPINLQIKGLFFMATVEQGSTNGTPKQESAFGSTRLLVPANELTLAKNLYFADYYCMRGGNHYVTLVMTRPGSETDRFCRKRLLSLSFDDPETNPFLFRDGFGRLQVSTRYRLEVEVLFTEDLNISKYQLVAGIPTVGKGHSTKGGLPKNPHCVKCNLPRQSISEYEQF